MLSSGFKGSRVQGVECKTESILEPIPCNLPEPSGNLAKRNSGGRTFNPSQESQVNLLPDDRHHRVSQHRYSI